MVRGLFLMLCGVWVLWATIALHNLNKRLDKVEQLLRVVASIKH